MDYGLSPVTISLSTFMKFFQESTPKLDQVVNYISRRMKTLYNKVTKIDMVKFTHHKDAVLCATKTDSK